MFSCRRLSRLLVAVSLLTVVVPSPLAGAQPVDTAPYYLALGDSLAQGVQPNAAGHSVETDQGYADQLWSRYHAAMPTLRLAKLGCPGETTGTMIHGGICSYSLGSQLAQATNFLATHRVAFLTINIGANNVDSCVNAVTGLDPGCVTQGVAAAHADLPVILAALRQAGSTVKMVGMTYYDPFVAAALKGGNFVALAIQSESLGASFNQMLTAAFGTYRFAVADVATAFAPLNLPFAPYLDLPVDLALICGWTWMCAPPPIGPNIHANAAGYQVIALAFAQQIG